MNLAIDFGNTYAKAAVFEGDKLIKMHNNLSKDTVASLKETYRPKHIIVSSVSTPETEIKNMLGNVMMLSASLPLPFKIAYKTPATLGLDRIAGVAGAQGMFPEKNCLIIDAGTCITYDFIDKKDTYHGGSITPGMKMRFEALHHFTANLPLVTPGSIPTSFTGHTTDESIQTGVIWGIIAEINEIIRMYSDKYANLRFVICGGDAVFFEKKLKGSIFVAPELVLRGLNRILMHNA